MTNTKKESSDSELCGISGSQLKGKIIKRHPCCDNPNPKRHTESKRNGKAGGYSTYTKCENCKMRY